MPIRVLEVKDKNIIVDGGKLAANIIGAEAGDYVIVENGLAVEKMDKDKAREMFLIKNDVKEGEEL